MRRTQARPPAWPDAVEVSTASFPGTQVGTIFTPGDLYEAAELMRSAAELDQTVAFAGGGTKLGFGYPPQQVDVLVKTERLARIVDYAASDMVVEAEAGITLAALQSKLASHQQRLALDAPNPDRATLGGLVATNSFGPRRARYGSLRDLIVGVSLIRADGSRVRGGGKVVKNVAGFDLPKIAVGSLGTLGMIATVTLRLHPVPETSLGVRIAACTIGEVQTLVRDLIAQQLEPAALIAARWRGAYALVVLFEGFAAGVSEQAERFSQLATQLGLRPERIQDPKLTESIDEAARAYGNVRLRIAVPPGALEKLEHEALSVLAAALDDAKAVVYPTLGIAFFSGYADARTDWAQAVLQARAAVEALRGNLVLLDVHDATFAEKVDVYGTLPPSFPLMRRLKDRFDPAHRLNRGRFLGGL